MLALHLLTAIGMAAFAGSLTPLGVVAAFVLVYLALKVGGRLFRTERYVRKVELGAAFVAWFVAEVVNATLDVARLVVARRVEASPAVVPVKLADARDFVATLLGMLMTLTPGTMALEYDPDTGVMYVHALDTQSVERVESSVRRIEVRLLAWLGAGAGGEGGSEG